MYASLCIRELQRILSMWHHSSVSFSQPDVSTHVTGNTYWQLSNSLLFYHKYHHHQYLKSICCRIFRFFFLFTFVTFFINTVFFVFILTCKRKLCHIFRTLGPRRARTHARTHCSLCCLSVDTQIYHLSSVAYLAVVL